MTPGMLAHVQYSPTPLSAPPRQATRDDQLVALWLHGRAPNTQRAYAADADRFRAFVAKPLAMVTLGDLQAFADSLRGALWTRLLTRSAGCGYLRGTASRRSNPNLGCHGCCRWPGG